jgi:hypothetical protein
MRSYAEKPGVRVRESRQCPLAAPLPIGQPDGPGYLPVKPLDDTVVDRALILAGNVAGTHCAQAVDAVQVPHGQRAAHVYGIGWWYSD